METLIQLVFILSMLVAFVSVTGIFAYWVDQKRDERYAKLKESYVERYKNTPTEVLEYWVKALDHRYAIETPSRDMKTWIEAIEEILESRSR